MAHLRLEITIAGTDRSLATTTEGELTTVPAFTGAPEQLWAIQQAKTASAKPGPDGFLSRWLLLEPIPGDGLVVESAIRAAAKKEYFPNQDSVLPRAGDKVTVGGADHAWHAVDCGKHNVNLYHFAFYNGKPTTNQVFWGVTIVNSPEEISNVRLAVGSNAGSVWWVNGEEKNKPAVHFQDRGLEKGGTADFLTRQETPFSLGRD